MLNVVNRWCLCSPIAIEHPFELHSFFTMSACVGVLVSTSAMFFTFIVIRQAVYISIHVARAETLVKSLSLRSLPHIHHRFLHCRLRNIIQLCITHDMLQKHEPHQDNRNQHNNL